MAAFVNEAHNDSSGAALTADVTITLTAGNQAVCVVAKDGSSPPAVSKIEGAGGTAIFSKLTGLDAATWANVELWGCTAIGAGVTKVTVTMASAVRFGATVSQYSSAAFGATNTASGNGTSGSVAVSGAAAVAGGFSLISGIATTAATGTMRCTAFASNQGNVAVVGMDNLAGTTVGITWSTAQNWAGAAVAIVTPPTATISGTGGAGMTETDVVVGGKTIVITIADDTLIA